MRPHRLDKPRRAFAIVVEYRSQRLFALNLNLTISPVGDFDHSIDDRGIVLEWIERDLRNAVSSSKRHCIKTPSY
jgi:hypothetical protein